MCFTLLRIVICFLNNMSRSKILKEARFHEMSKNLKQEMQRKHQFLSQNPRTRRNLLLDTSMNSFNSSIKPQKPNQTMYAKTVKPKQELRSTYYVNK
jgi:phosphate starvation-inducible protein PhoH